MARLGIQGCGVISEFLLDGLKRSGGELAAVCDVNGELARKIAGQWGAKAYTDPEAFLDDTSVEGVINALPSHLHYEYACLALDKGKHVFCEKPMTIRVSESRDLLERARTSGRVFQMGYMKRYHPAYGALKGLAETIGPLHGASVQLTLNGLGWRPQERAQEPGTGTWHWDLTKSGGGFLTHSGSHLLDLIQYLFGPPAKAHGKVEIDGSGNEYNTNVLLTCADDLPVHLDMRYVAIEGGSAKKTPWDERVEIVGWNGRASAEGYDWQGQLPCRLKVETPKEAMTVTEHDSTLQWVGEFEAFQRAIAGESTYASSAEDGYRVDVMLATLRSLGATPREAAFNYEL